MTVILKGCLILLIIKINAPNGSMPLKLSTVFTFYWCRGEDTIMLTCRILIQILDIFQRAWAVISFVCFNWKLMVSPLPRRPRWWSPLAFVIRADTSGIVCPVWPWSLVGGSKRTRQERYNYRIDGNWILCIGAGKEITSYCYSVSECERERKEKRDRADGRITVAKMAREENYVWVRKHKSPSLHSILTIAFVIQQWWCCQRAH